MSLSAKPKFPIFGLGAAYTQGVIGDATIEFRGSGLVATCYGLPGLTATLIGTGLYDIRFPVARGGVRLFPETVANEPKGPTGALLGPAGSGGLGVLPGFDAKVSHVSGVTGSALLHTLSQTQNPSGAVGGTGAVRMFPPTGTAVNLLLLGSPITRY